MSQTNTIKLININIEMNRHLDTVSAFLEREKPDVVCLQELVQRDVPRFEKLLGMKGGFAPMATLDYPGFDAEVKGLPYGTGMFSRFSDVYTTDYYSGNADSLPSGLTGGEGNKTLIRSTFAAHGKTYTVGATHFTWTPDGEANDAQRQYMTAFLAVLKNLPDSVFCGDFNAPRGGEMWTRMAAEFTDNIPSSYDSSLDPKLHRVGHLRRMVDGIFSTPEYKVTEVTLVEGISDHKAVVGFVERI